jgi:hypothetical protein
MKTKKRSYPMKGCIVRNPTFIAMEVQKIYYYSAGSQVVPARPADKSRLAAR